MGMRKIPQNLNSGITKGIMVGRKEDDDTFLLVTKLYGLMYSRPVNSRAVRETFLGRGDESVNPVI